MSTSVGGVSSLSTSLVQVDVELMLKLLARLCKDVGEVSCSDAVPTELGVPGLESEGEAKRLERLAVVGLGRSFLRLWVLLIRRIFSSGRRLSDSAIEPLELEREWLPSRKMELDLVFFSLM